MDCNPKEQEVAPCIEQGPEQRYEIRSF
jgi:hypothetical protein